MSESKAGSADILPARLPQAWVKTLLALVLASTAALIVPPNEAFAQGASCNIVDSIEVPAASQDVPTIVPVDYYALVLSWSPGFCHPDNSSKPKGGKDKHQCIDNRFEWVVHGLWPQSAKGSGKTGQPRNCKPASSLSRDLIRKHMCTVPGGILMQHQWQAHGVCAWDKPEEYFGRIESLMTTFQRPGYAEFAPKGAATAADIKQSFAASNPGLLKPEHLAVFVASGQSLKEVFICLDKEFRPRACTGNSTPDAQRIKVRAPSLPPEGPAKALYATTGPAGLKVAADAQAAAGEDQCPRPQSRFNGYAKAAKSAFWDRLYAQGGETIYCGAPFSGRNTAGGLPLNIEHALPQSKIQRPAGKGDLHNLWPSIVMVNSARSNHTLVPNIPGENWAFVQHSDAELRACDFEVQTFKQASGARITVVEPREAARGPLARSILHMAMAYQVRLGAQERATYIDWHKRYPVTAEEEQRNDMIEALQGTRNPLIDSPESADILVRACSVAQ